jgi:hypothetical protein
MKNGPHQAGAEAALVPAGIVNPRRLIRLILETIQFFDLDLSGLTVLTEAASGPYVVTPVIASLAGARKVLAITTDSRYARASEVIKQTRALELLCRARPAEISTRRARLPAAEADIVTNLGFVRPINSAFIARMKSSAVVPLMYEAWEFRPGDLDLEACRQRGIPVAGTNEDFPGLEVFAYCGWLALKLLFEAGIEIHKTGISIISSDNFGQVLKRRLELNDAKVTLALRCLPKVLRKCDVVIVADYAREGMIIGTGGDITVEEFARAAPHATVIQFVGQVDVQGLQKQGISVYPGIDLGPHRMAKTLADLGPRPVVELHTAGLKVAELLWKAKNGKPFGYRKWNSLIQPL